MFVTLSSPAVHTFEDEIAFTPKRMPPPLGFGLEKTLQLLPFHRSIKGYVPSEPTAQASPGETATTDRR
jgi:hypothetical protein